MSNTDTELFELCKQVYEATGWFQARKVTSWYHYFEPTPAKYHPGEWRIAFKERGIKKGLNMTPEQIKQLTKPGYGGVIRLLGEV